MTGTSILPGSSRAVYRRLQSFSPVSKLAGLGAVLALVGAVASASVSEASPQIGAGRIAFASGAGIFTLNPDGSALTLFRANGRQPRWSPDGARLAFTQYNGGSTELFVINADGSGERSIATSSPGIGALLSRQAWSPDGTKIAYVADNDLYAAGAAGGDVRRLTFDGASRTPPVWSPTGALLAFSSGGGLFVIAPDGSGRTQIAQGPGSNADPVWSPSGAWIAFSRELGGEPGAIYIVRPDGTELHRVWGDPGHPAQPAWSPDGSKISFVTSRNTGYDRFGGHGEEIHVVDVAGSREKSLTEGAPQLVVDRDATWSPDGARIAFSRLRSGLYSMNADGTCEERLAQDAYEGSATWQPVPGGPPVGERRCHALAVEGTAHTSRYVSRVSMVATVSNEGTEPLLNVVLDVVASSDVSLISAAAGSREGSCSTGHRRIRCSIPRLDRGLDAPVFIDAAPLRVTRVNDPRIDVSLGATLSATASDQLLPSSRETHVLSFDSDVCTTTSRGSGKIVGTKYADRICGRRGADSIHPGRGRDSVDSGSGNDLIFGSDGARDVITCGPGRDRVGADPIDRVSRNCERVSRYRPA